MSSQNFRPASKSYGRVFARVVWTALFSAVQLWAIVVLLTQLHVDGVVAVALAAVISGAVLAALSGWQEVREHSRLAASEEQRPAEPVEWTRDHTIEQIFPVRKRIPGRDEVAV
ncbi:hypothetical protein GCM10010174_76570 [Kutzneria viridogrisea]|uniref:Uncharacterized protein n=1 Tax=Kutzneria viridogrisea TaxID=47990 RepID=A0ABR6BNK7_9PSEU|nr:hypothetical protein [Kutzneria viridogrisea]